MNTVGILVKGMLNNKKFLTLTLRVVPEDGAVSRLLLSWRLFLVLLSVTVTAAGSSFSSRSLQGEPKAVRNVAVFRMIWPSMLCDFLEMGKDLNSGSCYTRLDLRQT